MFEEIGTLYRGLVLGVMIAAPVGPVGLLCIRRTIRRGLAMGFATGIGAALADAIFSAIAAFGVAAIIDMVRAYNDEIYFFGGLFLLAVAWHSWHDRPKTETSNANDATVGTGLRAIVSGFALTISNPVTLFGILAVVATFGELRSHAEALILVAGIFLGSTAWWLMLAGGVSLIRDRFTDQRIILVNRITGAALALLALWAVVKGSLGFLGQL